MKIVVLVSGSGTNLQKIIDEAEKGSLVGLEINAVVADRDCFALERAVKHKIPAYLLKEKSDFWTNLNQFVPADTDLIVLAGFLSIIPASFIQKWKDKIINIHPSLLPKYGGKGMYGMHVHRAVLANGEKESGATVHYVTEGIDEGGIIMQKSTAIDREDTPEILAQKVHEIEYEILITALQKFLSEKKKA